MAPVIPDPKKIKPFKTQAAFETWLSKHHDGETELWIKLHKKASGLPTITYAEALDVALCWGWIDGIRKTFDESSFLQRFTPRRPKSIWSQVNRMHIDRLIREKRMTEHGLRQMELAKADGRWDNAYAPPSQMDLPEDLKAAIAKNKKASATLATLSKTNRFALAFRVGNMKTSASRQAKIDAYVKLLAAGRGPLDKASP